jgi:large subunit ribosomal protein L21
VPTEVGLREHLTLREVFRSFRVPSVGNERFVPPPRRDNLEDFFMYAVIQTGGKQYRVSPGDQLRVERLPGDRGATVTFDNVLMVAGDGAARVGKPTVAGVKVTAQILDQDRAKKIIVFKLKRRKNYRRKHGHRQHYTELKITGIEG